MSGGPGSGRRAARSGGGGGGTLPAPGFTYIGGAARPDRQLTLNNGAPAHILNNGSLRSLSDKKKNRNGFVCHADDFQRNADARYSRKQENGYLRNSETIIGFPRGGEREYERTDERRSYGEPEYSVIPEGGYNRVEEYPRGCAHSNTFNC